MNAEPQDRSSFTAEAPAMPLSLSPDDLRRFAQVLKLVAHEGRLAALILLHSGEKTVTELAAGLGLRQSACSQILSNLRAFGLVRTRRAGKSILYAPANEDVRDLVSLICRIKV